jgi:regulator of protease activity HflC (stomatin/prohibitin superfamily)
MTQTTSTATIRNWVIAGVVTLTMTILLAKGCNRINPTEVGFKISNSGDYRGIDSLPLVTGWQFTMPGFTYIVTIPTTQQHVVWTASTEEGSPSNQEITVSCQGGAGFKMDVGFNYRVNPNKASKIYLKYRTSDLSSITSTYLRNVVRGTMQDLSGTMTVDSILNNLPYYEHTVADMLTERLAKEGFLVDNFNITKQPIPTDKNLADAINAKIKAKQDAETSKMQLQQSIAEANKLVAVARGDSASKVINALADAEVIKVKTQSLTASPQYIELVKAEKWDGKLPQVQGTSTPFINFKN